MMLKVCGVRSAADVELLAVCGADLAGLWHGTGGPAELTVEELAGLAERCRAAGVVPVLVTLRGDPGQALRASGITWVQLHGYQPPALVRSLAAAGYSVLKVLHVRGQSCEEAALVPAYNRAGARYLLLDSAGDRIGSTGVRLDPRVVDAVAATLPLPFLLAGGIGADHRYEHPLLAGVDVDTGARDAAGALDAGRIAALRARWS